MHIPIGTIILFLIVGLYAAFLFRPAKVKTLYLIRGIPGSGKSTLAAGLAADKGIGHYEADQYFHLNPEGTYQFDIERRGDAHAWCQDKFMDDLYEDKSMVVSNTFTRWKELRFYVELAQVHGYAVEITECTGDYGSIHGVPEETMKAMRDRFIHNAGLPQLQGIVYKTYP